MSIYAQYYFWLTAISLICFALERIAPWRRQQKGLREGIWQDLFWLVFNGHYLGIILALFPAGSWRGSTVSFKTRVCRSRTPWL